MNFSHVHEKNDIKIVAYIVLVVRESRKMDAVKTISIVDWPIGEHVKFLALDAIDKEIVLKHLITAGSIRKFRNIRSHLICEFHDKKCTRAKSGKYTPKNKIIKNYYEKYIFLGRREAGDDEIQIMLKSELENVMFSQTNIRYIGVYYNHEEKPKEISFSSFDKDEWLLATEDEMTAVDEIIMYKFMMHYLDLLQTSLKIINCVPKIASECAKLIEKEIKHVRACME